MIEVGFGDVDEHESSFIIARYGLPQNLRKIAFYRVLQKFILVFTRGIKSSHMSQRTRLFEHVKVP
jgi:hypothetical protein